MIDINLLPWRTYLQERQKAQRIRYAKVFFLLLVSVYFILSIGLNRQCSIERSRVDELKKQLAARNPLASVASDNSEQTAWLTIYTQMERNQLQLVRFFYQLAYFTPEQMAWQTILSQGTQVLLVGTAPSFQVLLEFVKALERLKEPLHVQILKIKHLPGSDTLQFSAQVFQVVSPLSHAVEKNNG